MTTELDWLSVIKTLHIQGILF